MKKSAVIEYEYNKGAENMAGTFGIEDGAAARWKEFLNKFLKADEKNIADYFMGLVESGELTGSEILAMALAGFKRPLDEAGEKMKKLLQALGGD